MTRGNDGASVGKGVMGVMALECGNLGELADASGVGFMAE